MPDALELRQANEILIVDDTPPSLGLLAGMLTKQGYRVREAVDGPSALEAIRKATPDIVLLDVRMPGMDGYEVCRRIKTNEDTRSIPVIFISALDEQDDKVQGFSAGGVDYITKPFEMPEVLARIETHLTIRRLQRQLEQQNARLQKEITDRRRAETTLQALNEDLERRVEERTIEARRQARQVVEIMNSVPEGLLLLSPNGRIILANPSAQKYLRALNISPVNRSGQGLQIITRLGNRALHELLLPPKQGVFHEIVQDDQIFEVAARPVVDSSSPAGGPLRWVMLIREVSGEREMERRLAQQDRLAAVGQMAAGIAHDFNNILAVILLYTEMALNMADLPPQLAERLTIIASQSRQASELIIQILDFSRHSALERRSMDLLPFIKEQVELLGRTLPENIRIEMQISPGDYQTQADPTRMQQMLMNLASNARDAMPDGGKLSIGISRCAQDEPIECIGCGKILEGDWLRIDVQDTGQGIAPDDLQHIFEPFFTTKVPGKGTGLGLAQVYGIIKSHEGHLSVRSTVGLGTSFHLYFPAGQPVSNLMADTRPERLVRGQGQTILLVEDEATTRQALAEGLMLINYNVAPVSNGKEALEYLHKRESRVDLVLSDVVMPEMGGLALLSCMRRDGFRTPVIFMTGHPLPNDNRLEEKPLVWLQKPPRLKQLANILAQAFR